MSDLKTVEEIKEALKAKAAKKGLEFYPFCIGWYNEQVKNIFHLPYSESTVAFCIISSPSFFENGFLPYLNHIDCNDVKDPLDQCLSSTLNCLKDSLQHDIDIIHDYDLHPTRRPKVLVQTAGHVAGAAYYYQKTDVLNQPWGEKKIYSVSIHPEYGGWFAFRGIIIFKDVLCSNISKVYPRDFLSNEEKIQVLDGYNFHWKEWTFRDVSSPSERYSDVQKRYFQTKPADRMKLIKTMINSKLF